MLTQVAATIIGLAIAIFALSYSLKDNKLVVDVWDKFRRRPKFPGWPYTIALFLAISAAVINIWKAYDEQNSKRQAEIKALRMEERIKTVILEPTITFLAQVDETTITSSAMSSPDQRERLDRIRRIISSNEKETIKASGSPPPVNDRCYLISLFKGRDALDFFGAAVGQSISVFDFIAIFGFIVPGRELTLEEKQGFNAFDFSMSVRPEESDVYLYFSPAAKQYWLIVPGKPQGYTVTSIASMSELPGSLAVLENTNTHNAFSKGIVNSLFIKDGRSGREFGILFESFRAAQPAEGWPKSTWIAHPQISHKLC